MAIGPLGRILAQVVMVAGSALGRAVVRVSSGFRRNSGILRVRCWGAAEEVATSWVCHGFLVHLVAVLVYVISSQAYKDAARSGATAGAAARSQPLSLRPRMSPDEARKILGFDSGKQPTKEEILARYDRLFQINAPSGNFAGSPYLQKRVAVARTIMLEECGRTGSTSNGASSQSNANARD